MVSVRVCSPALASPTEPAALRLPGSLLETQFQATLGILMQQEGGRRRGTYTLAVVTCIQVHVPASVWSTHLHPPSSSCLSMSPLSCKAPLRPLPAGRLSINPAP